MPWIRTVFRWVRASYGVASAYVLADTVDKGKKMNEVWRSRCEHVNM